MLVTRSKPVFSQWLNPANSEKIWSKSHLKQSFSGWHQGHVTVQPGLESRDSDWTSRQSFPFAIKNKEMPRKMHWKTQRNTEMSHCMDPYGAIWLVYVDNQLYQRPVRFCPPSSRSTLRELNTESERLGAKMAGQKGMAGDGWNSNAIKDYDWSD